MRIGTAHRFEAGLDDLQRRQRELAQSQEQLTSGKRVSKPSDDPTAAARAERAMVSIARRDADQRALEASRHAMTLGESALADAGDLLQRARELLVASGNGSYGDAERASLAQELAGIRSQLFALANRDDGAGNRLFAGQGSAAAPFVDGAGGVTFEGAPGELGNAASEALPLSIDGESAWLGGAAGGVFALLDRVAGELATPGRTPAQIAATTRGGLADVDERLDALQALRTRIGESLGRADGIEARTADARLAAQAERATAEDLDMVQAIAEFQTRQTGYDAALKTYASVQRLSLFDYLNGR